MLRRANGQFLPGNKPHGKGWTNSGSFRVGHKKLNNSLERWRESGGLPWNKGKNTQTNTGRTHFAKGHIPANYKGGISKTRAYHNFYSRRREAAKKRAAGCHTFGEWEVLKAQFNWTCPCCKRIEPDIRLSQDHIVPVSRGGSDNIENIQPLCRSCNSRKHTKIIRYLCQ